MKKINVSWYLKNAEVFVITVLHGQEESKCVYEYSSVLQFHTVTLFLQLYC